MKHVLEKNETLVYKNYLSKKRLKFVIYTLFVIFISSFVTLIAINKINININALRINRGKLDYTSKNDDNNFEAKFDKIIAFGPDNYEDGFTIDTLLKSNLINDDNKEELELHKLKQKKYNKKYVGDFQIYLAIKNDIEYIYLIDYLPTKGIFDPAIKDFIFESTLSYSIESLVNDFEKIMDKEITDSFLNSSITIKIDGEETLLSGIIIDFVVDDEGIFNVFYTIKDNENIIVVNK